MSNTSEDLPGGYKVGYSGQNLFIVLPGKMVIELIHCSAGTFMMGSPLGEAGRKEDEVRHRVEISRDFYLGKYLVTQEQYNQVMGPQLGHSNFWTSLKNGKFIDLFVSRAGRRWPATEVSWTKAATFCKFLNDRLGDNLPEGYKLTLPSEAQWEYACRAGTGAAFNNGRSNLCNGQVCDNLHKLAWYFGNCNENYQYNRRHAIGNEDVPRAVGRKLANDWGFFDMHGNVAEWCSDWYGTYDEGRRDGQEAIEDEVFTDPTGPLTSKEEVGQRVVRGGTLLDDSSRCRSASRGKATPYMNYPFVGFRLAASFGQEIEVNLD